MFVATILRFHFGTLWNKQQKAKHGRVKYPHLNKDSVEEIYRGFSSSQEALKCIASWHSPPAYLYCLTKWQTAEEFKRENPDVCYPEYP